MEFYVSYTMSGTFKIDVPDNDITEATVLFRAAEAIRNGSVTETLQNAYLHNRIRIGRVLPSDGEDITDAEYERITKNAI